MPDLLHPQTAFVTFLEYLEVERNVSRLTIRNYSHYLRKFLEWFTGQGLTSLKSHDKEVVRQWRVHLARQLDDKGHGLSKRTQSYYIIALRSWLKWLIKQDMPVLHPEKIELPKVEAHQMKFLQIDKVERLLGAVSISTPTGLRDKAILELLFSTGLRVSELVGLNRDQVDTNTREFGVIGKGRRARVVFLSERAAHWLERYLVTRTDIWSPVFIHIKGKQADPTSDGEEMRLTTRSVQRIVDHYSRLAKLPIKISPHGIRHSFATDLLSNGASLRDVQEMLGHKDISTTQIYTHVTKLQLKEAHQKFHSDM